MNFLHSQIHDSEMHELVTRTSHHRKSSQLEHKMAITLKNICEISMKQFSLRNPECVFKLAYSYMLQNTECWNVKILNSWKQAFYWARNLHSNGTTHTAELRKQEYSQELRANYCMSTALARDTRHFCMEPSNWFSLQNKLNSISNSLTHSHRIIMAHDIILCRGICLYQS